MATCCGSSPHTQTRTDKQLKTVKTFHTMKQFHCEHKQTLSQIRWKPVNSSDVHLKNRFQSDEMLRRTHLCVSLYEAETRKERTSVSGSKVEVSQRGNELLLPPRGFSKKHICSLIFEY